MRSNCNHGHHDGPCGYRYIEDVEFADPQAEHDYVTYVTDVCRCIGDHE